MGGEKLSCISLLGELLESPPRWRGKVFLSPCPGWRARITPAWAGKSCCSSSVFCIRWDHPRVGGEKSGAVGQMTDKQGSPPRGQGKVAKLFGVTVRRRITPA